MATSSSSPVSSPSSVGPAPSSTATATATATADGAIASAKAPKVSSAATATTAPDADDDNDSAALPAPSRNEGAKRPEEPRAGFRTPADAATAGETPERRRASSPADSIESGETNSSSSPSSSPARPPLPDEPAPGPEDDGWEYHWNPNTSSYWFYNRHTGVWQQENPRVPNNNSGNSNGRASGSGSGGGGGAPGTSSSTSASAPLPPPPPPSGSLTTSAPGSVANGYNPAIHGDYDPTAWYAQAHTAEEAVAAAAAAAAMAQQQQMAEDAAYLEADDEGYADGAGGFFNRQTGRVQRAEQGAERHGDEARSRRQLNAFFDVDAAANMHDGRSLKAERAGKKPSRAELKAFKEKRRAKKEEKRRAWLRD